MNLITTAEALKPGSPVLEPGANDLLLDLYSKALWELGSAERFYAAWLHVIEAKSFRPDISDIRRAAGINDGLCDPREKQAISALGNVLGIMREFGPKLQAKPGKIVRDTYIDEDGGPSASVLHKEPDTPPPALCEKTEATLAKLGSGSREGGLQLLAGHPALPWNWADMQDEAPKDRSFRVKTVTDIERLWISAWVGAR